MKSCDFYESCITHDCKECEYRPLILREPTALKEYERNER
jgi:hypothetical protein